MGFPNYRVGHPTLPGPSGGFPDLFRTSEWVSRPISDLWVGILTLPGPWVGLPTRPEPPGGSPGPFGPPGGSPDPSQTLVGSTDPSRTSGWVYRPFPDHQVVLPTLPGPLGGCRDPSRTPGWDSRTFTVVRVGL